MKKIIVIITLVLLSFTLVGCKSYEDYIPLEEAYGSWDGNYIYYGNVRCKTTGEDEQLLVEEIYYNEQIYKIDSLQKFDYINKDVYMIMSFNNENDQYINVFLKYDIMNKAVEILFVEEENYIVDFFVLENRYFFLKIRKFEANYQFDEYYIRYDSQNKTFINFIEYNLVQVLNDIILFTKSGITYYTKYDDINFIEIGRLEDGYNKLVSINNKKYLLNISSSYAAPYVYYKSLSIYDFETNKLHNIIDYNDGKQFELINDEYIIFYQTKPYEYVSSLKNMSSKKYEILKHYLNVNNVLSKIDYTTMKINDIYTFEEKDIDYTYGYIEDNRYYIVSERVIRGNQINQGDVKTQEYVLSLSTFKLTKYSSVKKESSSYVRDEIIVDNYGYYWESHSIVPMMSSSRVNFLYREDKTTKEVKVMQFFGFVMDEIKGTRYSKLFVEAYHDYRDFEKILILNY